MSATNLWCGGQRFAPGLCRQLCALIAFPLLNLQGEVESADREVHGLGIQAAHLYIPYTIRNMNHIQENN